MDLDYAKYNSYVVRPKTEEKLENIRQVPWCQSTELLKSGLHLNNRFRYVEIFAMCHREVIFL